MFAPEEELSGDDGDEEQFVNSGKLISMSLTKINLFILI